MTAPISGTPAVGVSAASTGSPAANGDRGTLSSQAFLQLLVAQLRYQDPSKPVDTSSFMSETATLSQVQTMQQLASSSNAMLLAQQTQSATSMVGRSITYTDTDGHPASGVVTAATLSGGAPTLQVGQAEVPLASVTQVRQTT